VNFVAASQSLALNASTVYKIFLSGLQAEESKKALMILAYRDGKLGIYQSDITRTGI
jgi:hypothetical protein